MFGLYLTGCSTDADPPPCRDLPCEASRAAELHAVDPATARQQVTEETDPMVRAFMIEAIFEQDPSAADSYCPLLPDGMVQQRCKRIAADPTRWSLDPERPTQGRLRLGELAVVLAPGPTFRHTPLPRGEVATCPPEIPTHTCRTARAIEAGLLGDAPAAAGACEGIASARWRDACMAEASAAACQEGSLDSCGIAAELCLEAGAVAAPCLAQIAGQLAASAPATEGGSPDDWATLVRRVRELRTRLQPIDAILADRLEARIWAETLMLAYGLARSPNGAILELLPPEAVPHARAAIAWRLAVNPEQTTLAERAAHVGERMARTERRKGGQPMAASRVQVRSLWHENMPGEETIAWTAFMQSARRAISSNPDTDARICVLEAGARLSPPAQGLLEQGLRDEDPLVRWTAARLLAQVAPESASLGRARKDSDPLVAQRAASAVIP